MTDEFDALDFAGYVRERWLAIAISCGVAAGLAIGISSMLPRRYTATASILIQFPGGNDPRAATAVSPVYLESLKSYERFASSDTLFARALDAVHARDGDAGGPIEAVKRRVLKVSKPPSVAVLEISATLRDPKKAQALAQYVAEQTVELDRSLDVQSSVEPMNEFRAQLNAARARLATAQAARNAFAVTEPVESLENEVQEASDLRSELERDLEDARTDLADYTAQRQALQNGSQRQDDGEWLTREIASAQARISALEGQRRELNDTLAKKSPQLEERRARLDTLESDEKSATAAVDAANARMNEMLSTAAFHGERLRIIDPGIVPQQPSSPNTMLNLAAALMLSLVGSGTYLAFRFGHARLTAVRSERLYRLRQTG